MVRCLYPRPLLLGSEPAPESVDVILALAGSELIPSLARASIEGFQRRPGLTEFAWHVERLPAFGQEALLVTTSGRQQGRVIIGETVIWRRGGVVATVGMRTTGEPRMLLYAERQDTKLRAARALPDIPW